MVVVFDDLSKIIKERDKEYVRLNPPDFITHNNYIEYLAFLSKDLSLDYKSKATSTMPKIRNLDNKITLVKLTIENLQQEYKVIQENPDFAVVCVCWVSVKSYYMIFNLLMILRYLITCDDKSFSCSHTKLLHEMIEYLDRGELIFSKSKFNTTYIGKVARDWKPADSSNHVRNKYNREMLYLQIIKMLQRYKEEDYRRSKGIKNLRTKSNKLLIDNFRNKSKVGLLEFFYWYRIKASYRDLEFLDKEIPAKRFANYYSNYYDLTMNMFYSLKKLINELAVIRLGSEIIKFA